MQQEKKTPMTEEEHLQMLRKIAADHRHRMETDEEYRRETEEFLKGFEQVKHLVGESEE